MIVEASNENWYDQTQGTAPADKIYLKRIGARHGRKTADGLNAWTNLAFFDGHVSLYASEPLTRQAAQGKFPGMSNPDNNLVSYYTETIFFINRQKSGQ